MIGCYEEKIGAQNTMILRKGLSKEISILKNDMLKITKHSKKIINNIYKCVIE